MTLTKFVEVKLAPTTHNDRSGLYSGKRGLYFVELFIKRQIAIVVDVFYPVCIHIVFIKVWTLNEDTKVLVFCPTSLQERPV